MSKKKPPAPGRRAGFQYDLIVKMMERGYWPATQLAEHCAVSSTTIYRYITDGTIAGEKIGKRWWVIAKSAQKYWGVLVKDFDPLKEAKNV